jgi:UDP-glucose 4-epimerase
MKENILVTGGAGYIGSKVSHDLIQKKFKVIIIDNLSTGYNFLVPKESSFVKGSVLNVDILDKLFKKYKFKSVMHFAASLSVEESQRSPLKYYNNNVIGTDTLLKVATKYGVKNFIMSSTCAVYGVTQKGSVDENSYMLPESNYGKTKLLAETILKNYAKKFKFKYAILRYFNVIGADNDLNSVPVKSQTLFKTLSKNIAQKKYKINLFGNNYNTKDGTCIRDFIDVNDLSAIHLETLREIKKRNSFEMNCGYGQPLSVLEVVNNFSKITGIKIKINNKLRRKGDMEKIYCDNKKLQTILKNWKRKVSINQSIQSQLNWEIYLKKCNVKIK